MSWVGVRFAPLASADSDRLSRRGAMRFKVWMLGVAAAVMLIGWAAANMPSTDSDL